MQTFYAYQAMFKTELFYGKFAWNCTTC